MAYPVAMETLAALPRDIWERTPPKRKPILERLRHGWPPWRIGCVRYRSSSTRAHATPHVHRRVIRRSLSVQHAHEVSAVVGGNRAIPARRAPWYLWKTLMRWSSSNPSSVAVATRPYRATIRRRFVIK